MKLTRFAATVAGGLALTACGLSTAAADPGGSAPADVQPMGSDGCALNGHGAQACFTSYGDKITVYDWTKDGYSAAAYWETNYGRSGVCYASGGAGTHHTCNYNMKEGTLITVWAVDVDRQSNTWLYWSNPVNETI